MLIQALCGEWLRRQKEMPALDGSLSTKIVPLENGQLLLSVEALWNNRSPMPLSLNIDTCHLDVYRVTPDLIGKNCVLNLQKDLGAPVCSHKFLVGMCDVDYVLEPNTASTILNHFTLAPGVYGIRMVLYSQVIGGKWWKELIVDVHHPKTKSQA